MDRLRTGFAQEDRDGLPSWHHRSKFRRAPSPSGLEPRVAFRHGSPESSRLGKIQLGSGRFGDAQRYWLETQVSERARPSESGVARSLETAPWTQDAAGSRRADALRSQAADVLPGVVVNERGGGDVRASASHILRAH